MNDPKFLNEPRLTDLLDAFERDMKVNFNCHLIGRIESFDPSTCTAQVSVLYKKHIDNGKGGFTYADYPALNDVPCISLNGGKTGITFPIAVGDECLLLVNDRDINSWYASGVNGPLESNRLHSLADAIALVGLHSLANKVATYDNARAVLYNGTTLVGVGTSLVKIANNQYTLGTLLNNLCSQLNSLTTAIAAITVSGVQTGAGVSGTPANATAISNIGTQISQIATQLQGLLE